jgi:hypothetical protein
MPAPVDAVELKQMCGRRRSALELIEVPDFQAIVGAGISVGARHASQRRA